MSTIDFSKTNTRILILLMQFLILLGSFIYADYIYLANIRPDQLIKNNFTQTECLIMSKKISTKGKFFHRSRADFLINYHANGVQYNRWVSGNGLDMSYGRNGQVQDQLLAEYKIGGSYTCWYNQENAEVAVLLLRHGWSLIYPLLLPMLIGLTALILFMKTGWQLLAAMRNKNNRV
jgi:hypothetical protein